MVHLAAEFSDADYDALATWLERRSHGILDIVELEGFLTAIVISPNTLSPLAWLPKVWGGKAPKFKDNAECNHFVSLVMGYYNDLVAWFELDPQRFEPTFYESTVEGRRIHIVDEWCVGFLKGMRLDSTAWKPLKKQHPELLKPIELFGSRAGWKELEASGDEKMHRKWSLKIMPAVRAIHQFWMPYRVARHREMTGETTH